MMWGSVPQMATARTRQSTSNRPGTGRSTSSTANSLGALTTSARTRGLLLPQQRLDRRPGRLGRLRRRLPAGQHLLDHVPQLGLDVRVLGTVLPRAGHLELLRERLDARRPVPLLLAALVLAAGQHSPP